MNWIGGTRSRVQQNNLFHNRIQAAAADDGNNNGAQGDGDPSTTTGYRLRNNGSGGNRKRTVPLLSYVQENFPNGDVLSLQLSHQMEINVIRDQTSGSRPTTYTTLSTRTTYRSVVNTPVSSEYNVSDDRSYFQQRPSTSSDLFSQSSRTSFQSSENLMQPLELSQSESILHSQSLLHSSQYSERSVNEETDFSASSKSKSSKIASSINFSSPLPMPPSPFEFDSFVMSKTPIENATSTISSPKTLFASLIPDATLPKTVITNITSPTVSSPKTLFSSVTSPKTLFGNTTSPSSTSPKTLFATVSSPFQSRNSSEVEELMSSKTCFQVDSSSQSLKTLFDGLTPSLKNIFEIETSPSGSGVKTSFGILTSPSPKSLFESSQQQSSEYFRVENVIEEEAEVAEKELSHTKPQQSCHVTQNPLPLRRRALSQSSVPQKPSVNSMRRQKSF